MSSRFGTRADRAAALVAQGNITKSPTGGFYVPASDGIGVYHVRLDGDRVTCTCPDFERRQLPCYHAIGCALLVARELTLENANG